MNTSIINKFYIWKNYKDYQQKQQKKKTSNYKIHREQQNKTMQNIFKNEKLYLEESFGRCTIY